MNAASWVNINDLINWDKNPKPHDAQNVSAIARSIVRFGFGTPLVVWKSTSRVVAGNGRLAAAALLMREDAGRYLSTDAPAPGLVPVRFVEFASEDEATAYGLADNRLTEVNPMSDSAVADLLREMDANGADIRIPGYDDAALDVLLAAQVVPTDDWGSAMAGLPSSDRAPIQQMTFTLHDDQAETIKRAMAKAKSMGPFVETGNENSNGNALARVAELFLGSNL
jgi:hypothetical protein